MKTLKEMTRHLRKRSINEIVKSCMILFHVEPRSCARHSTILSDFLNHLPATNILSRVALF